MIYVSYCIGELETKLKYWTRTVLRFKTLRQNLFARIFQNIMYVDRTQLTTISIPLRELWTKTDIR